MYSNGRRRLLDVPKHIEKYKSNIKDSKRKLDEILDEIKKNKCHCVYGNMGNATKKRRRRRREQTIPTGDWSDTTDTQRLFLHVCVVVFGLRYWTIVWCSMYDLTQFKCLSFAEFLCSMLDFHYITIASDLICKMVEDETNKKKKKISIRYMIYTPNTYRNTIA
jgi:hypothetical protein